MNLVVMSRPEIEQAEFTEPCVVISIKSPGTRDARIKGCGMVRDILRLEFSDSDPDSGYWVHPESDAPPETPTHMTLGHALEIVAFVETWLALGVDRVFVHCGGGISRSRGVAAGLALIYSEDDHWIYAYGHPNVHCKNLVLKAAHELLIRSDA